MASYHLHVNYGKKGAAHSHAAYISRTEKYSAKENSNYEDLEFTEHGNMPAWAAHNPLIFWQSSDEHERENGSTYREIEAALPRELNAEQRLEFVREFVKQEIGNKHAYQFGIHNKSSSIDNTEQPHVHIMFSERIIDNIDRDPDQYFKRYNAKKPERGGAKKASGGKLMSKMKEELVALRERFANMQNEFLEKYGHHDRVDHRSYKNRGIDKEPERHIGPWATDEERQAILERREAIEELEQEQEELAQALKEFEQAWKEFEPTIIDSAPTTPALSLSPQKDILNEQDDDMNNDPDELENFKLKINLVEYAASIGYSLVKSDSTRNSKVMKRGDSKIVIATGEAGHGIYFNVHNDRDSGSIIDFVKNRENINLGQVRKILRKFSGQPSNQIPELSKPVRVKKDIQNILLRYAQTVEETPEYLIEKRLIGEKILKDNRFVSMIRTDPKTGNAVFPFYNARGLCSYEYRGEGYRGMASGSEKGLWHSKGIVSADTIVICESVIDALSYAEMAQTFETNENAAYVSFGGTMSENQEQLLIMLINNASKNKHILLVLAVDNDKVGMSYIEKFKNWIDGEPALISNVSYVIDTPSARTGKDWNEALQNLKKQQIEEKQDDDNQEDEDDGMRSN